MLPLLIVPLLASLLFAPAAHAAPVGLEPLLDRALRQHPTLKAAAEAAEAQQARARAAGAPFWPQVGVNSSLSQSTNVSFAQTAAAPFTLAGGAVTFRQQLFDFGKTAAEVDAAEATARASALQVGERAIEVAYQVRATYLNWLRARGLAAQAEERVRAADRLYDQAVAFYRAGRRSRIDVTRGEASRAQAQAEAIGARAAVDVANRALAAALGQREEVAGEPVFPAVPAIAEAPLAELRQLALTHPGLGAAVAREASAEAGVRGAERARWPDLVADANYGQRLRDFVGGQNWSAGVGFSMPLLDGGAITNRRLAAEAQAAAAEADVSAQAIDREQAVERTYIQLAGTRARVPAAEAAARAARENLELAEGRYRAGVGSIIEISDAQLLVATAESDLVRARTDYHLAVAELLRAVGRTGTES